MELHEGSFGSKNTGVESERAADRIGMILAGHEQLEKDELAKKLAEVDSVLRGLTEEARQHLMEDHDLMSLIGSLHVEATETLH